MTITLYDSVDVSQIPRAATAAAGYVDGDYPTFRALRERFPHARLLSITVTPSTDAACLDIETGDAGPQDAPGWVRRQRAMGAPRPCLYANASTMPAVLAALAADGIPRGIVRLWSAHYSVCHICGPSTCAYPGVPECDGTQWTEHALGRNLDQSVLLDDFFAPGAHVDERTHECDGKTSLVRIAQEAHSQPSSVLRRTAVHDQRYAPELAQWLNAVFAGHLPATAPVPAGIKLRVPG